MPFTNFLLRKFVPLLLDTGDIKINFRMWVEPLRHGLVYKTEEKLPSGITNQPG
jgi:hypothetical protein